MTFSFEAFKTCSSIKFIQKTNPDEDGKSLIIPFENFTMTNIAKNTTREHFFKNKTACTSFYSPENQIYFYWVW